MLGGLFCVGRIRVPPHQLRPLKRIRRAPGGRGGGPVVGVAGGGTPPPNAYYVFGLKTTILRTIPVQDSRTTYLLAT